VVANSVGPAVPLSVPPPFFFFFLCLGATKQNGEANCFASAARREREHSFILSFSHFPTSVLLHFHSHTPPLSLTYSSTFTHILLHFHSLTPLSFPLHPSILDTVHSALTTQSYIYQSMEETLTLHSAAMPTGVENSNINGQGPQTKQEYNYHGLNESDGLRYPHE